MKVFTFLLGISAFALLSGCASTQINMADYHPVPMEKAEFMPSPAEVDGKRAKVVIFNPDSGGIRLAKSSRAAHTVAGTLEKYLNQAGVEIVDRSLASKLKKEIQLAEIKGNSDYTGPKVSDYSITGTISEANTSSSFSEQRQWQDKEGKWHVIPASCHFSANVSANLRIYKLPSLNYIKSIDVSGSASNSRQTRSSRCYLSPNAQNSLIRAAASNAIKAYRTPFQNFFAPKAYVEERRSGKKGDIFKLTQGSQFGFITGAKVTLYTKLKSINGLTGKVSLDDQPVATGIISNNVGPRYAWVKVEDKQAADKVRLGDFVKVKYQKSFFEGLGESLNSLSALSQ